MRRVFVHWGCHRGGGGGFLSTGGTREEEGFCPLGVPERRRRRVGKRSSPEFDPPPR